MRKNVIRFILIGFGKRCFNQALAMLRSFSCDKLSYSPPQRKVHPAGHKNVTVFQKMNKRWRSEFTWRKKKKVMRMEPLVIYAVVNVLLSEVGLSGFDAYLECFSYLMTL